MEPGRDLDSYGGAIFSGDITNVRSDYAGRVARFKLQSGLDEEQARKAATQEIYQLSWGPTRVPIYDLILLATIVMPGARAQILEVSHFLISEAKVPVDGVDLSGSQALHHCISTKPAFDPELAQILYDAGGDVNARNRYGGTAAHEVVLIYDVLDGRKMQRTADALKWFLDHGGNVDIKDGDGTTARTCIDNLRQKVVGRGVRLPMWGVLDSEDHRRKRLADSICGFCGRADTKLLTCSQCKKIKYCAPPRKCQSADWAKHKGTCKALKARPMTQAKYLGMPLS